jgi:hypothetical protein
MRVVQYTLVLLISVLVGFGTTSLVASSASALPTAPRPLVTCKCFPDVSNPVSQCPGCTVNVSNLILVSTGVCDSNCQVTPNTGCSGSADVAFSGGAGCSGIAQLGCRVGCNLSCQSPVNCPVGGGQTVLTVKCGDCVPF